MLADLEKRILVQLGRAALTISDRTESCTCLNWVSTKDMLESLMFKFGSAHEAMLVTSTRGDHL